MDNIVAQLAQQFGLQGEQAEAGAGAILKMLQEKVGGADVQELIAKVPGAETWIAQAEKLPTQAASEGANSGGGLLGQAAGLLGGLGGGGAGVGEVLGKLQASGLSAESAAQFVPALVEKLQAVVGPDLINKIVQQVPMLQSLVGGESGGSAGGLGGMLGKLLK